MSEANKKVKEVEAAREELGRLLGGKDKALVIEALMGQAMTKIFDAFMSELSKPETVALICVRMLQAKGYVLSDRSLGNSPCVFGPHLPNIPVPMMSAVRIEIESAMRGAVATAKAQKE